MTFPTYDEFLDNEKKRGMVVYKCTGCIFRGMGAAVTCHELIQNNKLHICYNEDTLVPYYRLSDND